MIDPIRNISNTASTLISDFPKMCLQQGSKDSLSSASQGPGCLMSIWQGFLRFFEAGFNLIKFFICCACKSPFPSPFKQEVDHSECKRIYEKALTQVEAPNQAQTNLTTAGSELIAFTDQIIHTFKETLKIDPEATQFALITIQVDKVSLSTSFHSVERQDLLSITASSLLTMLEGVTSEVTSVSLHVDYLRLSGNRIETHEKTHTREFGGFSESTNSTNALAFTRKGAHENFTREYNRITQSTTAPEKLFDEDGKLSIES